MSTRSARKEEHLTLAHQFFNQDKANSFDQMQLLRPALPESSVSLTSIQTTMFGKTLAAPFFINAMTGGSKTSRQINGQLAAVAHRTKIAMALGSASILAKEPAQLDTFTIAREKNPDGVLIANINPLTSPQLAQQIVTELAADALQIHLNVVQELAMPEGDRDFHWLTQLLAIRQVVTKPIIIKEVGNGLDPTTMKRLAQAGFDWFDVAGSGGTNFGQIENARNSLQDHHYLEKVGLPTVVAAKLAHHAEVPFIVSGGVRQPLDVFKGLVLGGKYVGVANTFLQQLRSGGPTGFETLIRNWQQDLAGLVALYGQHNLADLPKIKAYYDLEMSNTLKQLLS